MRIAPTAGDFVVPAAALCAIFVALDVEGPVRRAATLAFLLVAPGLAWSSLMGPMSPASRALVAIVGSTSLLVAISSLSLYVGAWSPTTTFWALTSSTVAAAWLGARRADPGPSTGPPGAPTSRPAAGAQPDDPVSTRSQRPALLCLAVLAIMAAAAAVVLRLAGARHRPGRLVRRRANSAPWSFGVPLAADTGGLPGHHTRKDP